MAQVRARNLRVFFAGCFDPGPAPISYASPMPCPVLRFLCLRASHAICGAEVPLPTLLLCHVQ
eukprot:705120-Rhodomonas_salina.1